jgi:soluble lytic murein transglycosylase-like protein/antitoxin (DNA-binding transcriptional repressor) of toxin-antitoxin stability system
MSGSFGESVSSFLAPNQLFDMERLRQAPQLAEDAHLNALMQRQQYQQQMGDADTETAARIAGTLLTNYKTPEERAAAYPSLISQAQANGRLKNAPAEYPGDEQAKAIWGMGTSSEKLLERQLNRDTNRALIGGDGTSPPAGAAPGSAVPAMPIPARGTGGPGATAAMPPEYLEHFRRASAETGIPMDVLIAQARQESSFNPNARGAAGEIGIFQIKPSTAQQPGFGMTGVDPGTLSDPGANIMFGARYLRARMGQGDPNNPADQARALAAYNGGGDPNYVANVNRYRPGMSPTDPAAAITTYTPGAPETSGGVAARTGGVNVAGPGAPPGAAAPAPGQFTPQQRQQLRVLAEAGRPTSDIIALQNQFRDENTASANTAYTRQKDDRDFALKQQERLERLAKERDDAARAGRKEEAEAKAAELNRTQTIFSQADKLRDEATKITETFRPLQESYERIGEAAAAGNSLGDLGLIYSYTRLLDPATVHEEEIKRGMQAGGLGEYVAGWLARVTKGESLTPAVRQQFLEMSRKFYDVRKKGYEKELDVYRNLAKKFNLDPDTVAVSVARDQPSVPTNRPPLSSFQR